MGRIANSAALLAAAMMAATPAMAGTEVQAPKAQAGGALKIAAVKSLGASVKRVGAKMDDASNVGPVIAVVGILAVVSITTGVIVLANSDEEPTSP